MVRTGVYLAPGASWEQAARVHRDAFAGSPECVADLACAVLDAGAARVDFGAPHGLSDTSGVHLLGTRVLPMLRRHITCNGRGG